MAFKSARQRKAAMSRLKGFFIKPDDDDLDTTMEHIDDDREFDYQDYDDTPEGHYNAHVDFFVKKRGWSRKEAEHYVQTHYKKPKGIDDDV